MEDILGMFGSIGETESIPDIINQFAQILTQLINLIVKFLGGDFSLGTNPEEETTGAAEA